MHERTMTSGGWTRSALGAAAALGGAAIVTLAAQVVWVVRRDLPSLTGLDASGVHGPSDLPHLHLVVLGDSTTTGPGVDAPEQIWLPRALDRLSLPAHVELTSLAVGGSRVADVRRRVPEVRALDPDGVVVAVGSNDAIHGTPPARFAQDLDAVVTELEQHARAVAVTNVGDLGNLARVPRPLNAVLRARSRAISRRAEAVVAAHERAVLLDVTSSDAEFRRGGVFAADLFHPNQAGHELWAAAALPSLGALLVELTRSEIPLVASSDDATPTGAQEGLPR